MEDWASRGKATLCMGALALTYLPTYLSNTQASPFFFLSPLSSDLFFLRPNFIFYHGLGISHIHQASDFVLGVSTPLPLLSLLRAYTFFHFLAI
jgi:hypothetical protein